MAMLHALGIYIQKDTGLEKIQSAQQEKNNPSSSMFFKTEEKPVNQLENIEEILHEEDEETNAKFYATMQFNAVYRSKAAKEFDFLHKVKLKSADIIFVISSKYELSPEEKAFLFKNMEHILIRPDTVQASLDDIIANPQGFIGKDLLIGRIQDKNKEIIAGMYKNIELVIKRGESLENLKEKAIHLNESAINFEKEARKLNSCCW